MGGGDADAGGEPAAAQATLHVRCTNGSKFAVRADLDATVGAFKAIVADSCDVPAPQQRLIYKGRILKDDQTLASYGASFPCSIRLLCCCCGRFDCLGLCGSCDVVVLAPPCAGVLDAMPVDTYFAEISMSLGSLITGTNESVHSQFSVVDAMQQGGLARGSLCVG